MGFTLPHFRNLAQNGYGDPSATWEPIYTNLFEIEFILPIALRNAGYSTSLFLTSAKSVTGLEITPDIPTIVQRFKYSTRVYLGFPAQTHLESVTIDFETNLNPDNNEMETYNALKAWYDLAWNSQTGATSYKRDMAGIVNIWQHDRAGKIIRRITLLNAMLKTISAPEFNWENTSDVWKPTATFACDVWEDIRIDTRAGTTL